MDTSFDIIIGSFAGVRHIESSIPHSSFKSILQPRGRIIVSDCEYQDHKSLYIPGSNFAGAEIRKITFEGKGTGGHPLVIATLPEEVDINQVYLITKTSDSQAMTCFETHLEELFHNSRISLNKISLADAEMVRGKHVISTIEIEKPFVINWNANEFKSFENLITSAHHMLWITRGGIDFAPTTGLLRVLRNEYPQSSLVSLELSVDTELASQNAAELIFNTWYSSLGKDLGDEDLEYAERDGKVFIPRILNEDSFDMELGSHSGHMEPLLTSLRSDSSVMLHISEPGNPARPFWKEVVYSSDPIQADLVEVQVEWISLGKGSFHDLTAIKPDRFGNQLAGTVIQSGCASELVKGDRVMVLGSQIAGTRIRQHRSLVQKIPARVPMEVAATTTWFHMIAMCALEDISHLSNGQSVLIHDAASCQGQALLNISQMIGAIIFVTVRSKAQKNLLTKKYNIQDDHIYDSNCNFAPHLKHKTKGMGVNTAVIFETSSAIMDQLSGCLALFGRVVSILDGAESTSLPPALMQLNASYSSLDVNEILRTSAPIIAKWLEHMPALFRSEYFRQMVPQRNFDVSCLSSALQWMRDPENIGTIAIRLTTGSMIPILPAKPPGLKLNSGGCYVLAGGLGSLGLRIARIMVESGAEHIIFLSRTGGGRFSEEIEMLREMGCTIDVQKCDICNIDQVCRVVRNTQKDGRRIRGLFQCAMVLQVSCVDMKRRLREKKI